MMTLYRRRRWIALCLYMVLPFGSAWANAQVFMDQGCLNCHGNPPRGKAPTLEKLVAQYAPLRDQPDALQRKADKLREHAFIGGIAAHERLTPEQSLTLLRWIADGGR